MDQPVPEILVDEASTTAGDGEVADEMKSIGENLSNSPTTESNKPKKRRCLRLDFGHSRDIFVTTFYRIWMYRRRHLLLTLLQLLVPPLLLIGMTAYLGTMLKNEKMGWTHYAPLDETELQGKICGKACDNGSEGIIAYYMTHPNTKFAKQFSTELDGRLNSSNIALQMVTEKEDLVRLAIRHQLKGEPEKFIAGIEIQNPSTDANTRYGVGNDFKVHFTVAMAQKVPGFTFVATPVFFDLNRNDPKYYYQLLGIELAVCRSFHDVFAKEAGTAGTSPPVSIKMRSLSYPPHDSYTLKPEYEKTLGGPAEEFDEYQGIDSMLATIFVLSMVPVIFTVVDGPVSEKENGFKLYLKLMGFPRAAYWFHWILNQMLIQLVVIAIQVWLIFIPFDPNTGPLVKYGDATLWFIVLVLFNLSSLSFFTFCASFGRRSKMTTYVTILIWLLSFDSLQSHVFDFNSSFSLFMVSCLLPSGCIHWSVYIFTTINSITWNTSVNFSLTQKSGFKLADVMLMMVLNFFVYFLLTLYMDNVVPGPMEVGQPWNYFFESIRCRFIDPNKHFRSMTPVTSGADFSRTRSHPVIQFKKLSKKFYLIDGVYGLENVQFNVNSTSITVLLGHKDSGKTTLMRVLCGAYAPTRGTVIVLDYDVRKNTQTVQSLLNVCMQNDMLCEYLTVMEHMKLIAKLKGVSRKKAKEECKTILEYVGLYSQRDDKMWRLAKWQRRVLCVAMALIGDAPILVLDAPTAGLDIDAKRQIWVLLKDLKAKGRTILMSTQDIDEANQIADSIVIMSRGRVAGVGAPSKLENYFEIGYHLNVAVMPSANVDDIDALLKKHVPTAREREGTLKRMKNAIQAQTWLHQSPSTPRAKSKTIIQIPLTLPEMGGALAKLFPAWSKDAETQTQRSIRQSTFRGNISTAKATSFTAMKATSSPKSSKVVNDDESFDREISYLLPARERANFPALFRDLDEAKTELKLGIQNYYLKWHSVETSFDKVDDYVDVLDAASNSEEDLQLDELVDTKTEALRIITDMAEGELMPAHDFRMEKSCCSCWSGVGAIIIKNLCHILGNCHLMFFQILVPILLLVITLHATNVHFSNDLLSTAIAYNTPTDLTAPVVPYRILSNDAEAKKLQRSFEKIASKRPNHITAFKNIGTSRFSNYYDKLHWHTLHDEILIAADFTYMGNQKTAIALFSPGHRHSASLSLLLMFNSVLDYEFSGKNKHYEISMSGTSMLHAKQYSILVNSTLPTNIIAPGIDITITVALAFGYFIFASGFVIQPCSERISDLKRYQMYYLEWNGLYWIANFIVDGFCNALIIGLFMLVIYYVPTHDVFRNPHFIILFIFTGTLGGFRAMLGSYYWSHQWKNKSTSYYASLSVNQFFGLFLFLLYTIINFDFFGKYGAVIAALTLQVCPPFAVTWNFHEGILWALQNGRCRAVHPMMKEELCSVAFKGVKELESVRKDCCDLEDEWSLGFIFNNENKGITPLWCSVAFLIVHCVVAIFLLMYMESRRSRRKLLHLLFRHEKPPALINQGNSKSIENERLFVTKKAAKLEMGEREQLFLVENLSTSVFNRPLLHPLSFVAEPGKCTVVVGPETSGITVLYEILAGLRAISEGSVSYGGFSLFSWGTRRKLLQQLGLSPSKSIALDKLTGYQLLALFGRLRRIPPKKLSTHINYWVETLGLQKKIRKHCESYSVVIKKKINIACAVIGNPNVVIFDDPLKDLDPLSKSEVCGVITRLINDNRVVLIVTHDLSCVQYLCNKLIILVNGQIQFCEDTDNICREISNEFTLTIKLKRDDLGKIDFKAFSRFVGEIEDKVDMALQEEQSDLLIYRIKNEENKYTWTYLFESVENVVSEHEAIVLDYNIRRTSLEDVYHPYAVKQRTYRSSISAWEEFQSTYC